MKDNPSFFNKGDDYPVESVSWNDVRLFLEKVNLMSPPPAATPKQPPSSTYPASPHIIGMDWIELAVRSPARSAQRYVSIGLSPRGAAGSSRAVAIGGTVIVFKRSAQKRSTGPTGTLLQMPVDNIQQKRQQLLDLGLTPSPLRRQRRGDQGVRGDRNRTAGSTETR